MQKLNDLSRSLTALEPDGTLIAVIEMSLSSWRSWTFCRSSSSSASRRLVMSMMKPRE